LGRFHVIQSALTIVAFPVFTVILSASEGSPGEAGIRINPDHSPALAPEGTA
jgi:hypothetical protein